MSFYLKWMKSNLIVMIVFVIALAAVPTGFIISNGMNKGIQEQVDTQVNKATQALRQISTTYELPAYAVEGEPWSYTGAPNALLNDTYRERREAVVEQIGGLRDWLEGFSKRDLELVIPELFPMPEGGESGPNNRVELSVRMVEEFPIALDSIVEGSGAAMPPLSDEVLAQLERARQIEVNRRLADRVEQVLSEEELDEITGTLSDTRVAIYESIASSSRFYADSTVFNLFGAADAYRNSPPNRSRFQTVFWEWQHTLWVYERVFDVLSEVNAPFGGTLLGGPLKRVLSVNADTFPLAPVSGSGDYSTAIAEAFEASFTGRVPANNVYDLRTVTVEFIASAGGINSMIDSIQTGSFVAVTDVDFTAYEPSDDLALGYFYGDEALVQGTMTLQTIWVRAWYEGFIPPLVRGPMGLPALEGFEDSQTPDTDPDEGRGGGSDRGGRSD